MFSTMTEDRTRNGVARRADARHKPRPPRSSVNPPRPPTPPMMLQLPFEESRLPPHSLLSRSEMIRREGDAPLPIGSAPHTPEAPPSIRGSTPPNSGADLTLAMKSFSTAGC